MSIPDGVYDWKNSKGQSMYMLQQPTFYSGVYTYTPIFKDDDTTSCTKDDDSVKKTYLIVVKNTCLSGDIYTFQWVYKTAADKTPPELNEFFYPLCLSIAPDAPVSGSSSCWDPYFSFQNVSSNADKKEYQTQIICPPMEVKPCSCIPKGYIVEKGTYMTSEVGTYSTVSAPCSVPWARTSTNGIETFTLSWYMDLTERFHTLYKEYHGLQPPLCLDAPKTYWRYFDGTSQCTQTGCGTTPDEKCKYEDMCACLEDNGIHDNPVCLAIAKKNSKTPWWAWLFIALGIVLVVIGITWVSVVISRKSKSRRRR